MLAQVMTVGHLIASANQRETELQNSETFLLSNMSPQAPQFNRGIWAELETKVRELNYMSKVFETYVICGPIFNFDQKVKTIGKEDEVTIPIPHGYFKSILAETSNGSLKMWSFILPNKETEKPLKSFLVTTAQVERYAGIKLWERLVGKKVEREKNRIRKMW